MRLALFPPTLHRRCLNVYQTPGVLEAIPSEDVFQALARHELGDWGDLGAKDKQENEFALGYPLRILSA
jgi:hypothetical protein